MLKTIIAFVGGVAVLATAVTAIIGAWRAYRKEPPATIVRTNAKPRILIIDDDADDLEQMRRTLNGDYQIFTERRAYRALADICQEYDHGKGFDLIITDCMMEPMTGERIVKIIRLMEMESGIRSPIAFFTRMGKIMTKPAGVVAIWRKPEDHLTLAKKVRELIASTGK